VLAAADFDPKGSCNLRHGPSNRAASSQGMPDAVLVFEERQDREQAGTVEGRHAQVFRLKRECQPDARIAEIASQLALQRQPRPQDRQQPGHPPGENVAQSEERPLQTRAEARQLYAVVVKEPAEAGNVARSDSGNLPFHLGDIRGATKTAAAAEDE